MRTLLCFLILFAVVVPEMRGEEETPSPAAEERPPVAMEGYCLVTLLDARRWARGKPEFSCVRDGLTFQFASEADREKFLAEEKYAQAFVANGSDVVRLIDDEKSVPGKRQFGIMYKGRVFLFEDEQNVRKFSQGPNRYLEKLGLPTGDPKPVASDTVNEPRPMSSVTQSMKPEKPEPPDDPYATPAEAFQAFEAAVANRKWSRYVGTLSPGKLDEEVFEALFVAGMHPDVEPIRDKYWDKDREQELDVHRKELPEKLSLKQTMELLTPCVTNKKQLVTEVRKHMTASQSKPSEAKVGNLRDVVINGQKASGKATWTHVLRSLSKTIDGEKEEATTHNATQTIYFINLPEEGWKIATQAEFDAVKDQ